MPDAVAEVGHLLAVVEALDPRAAQELRGGLPRCDSTFGLGLAFFLAATANGARAWLGPKRCRLLERLDGGALLDGLDRALAPRHRRTADGREWRVMSIPVMDGTAAGGCRGLLCAISDGADLQTGSALVLQMRLPALGAVQLVAAGGGRRLDVAPPTGGGRSSPGLGRPEGGVRRGPGGPGPGGAPAGGGLGGG
ncbi:hypothetical protein, partial [Azospirillum brasilense]|uniref:hypothetical protein n=1 Tax=Azospirillum brasilense TaxID=192 RepID=UPI001600087E